MMNLAWRDLRRNAMRFVLTGLGIALLTSAAMMMTGLYRGIVNDALLLIDKIGADVWLVQGGTQGPFAEASSVRRNLVQRAESIPGVAQSRAFLSLSRRISVNDSQRQVSLLGLDYPTDRGDWLPLVSGRGIRSSHYELVADNTLGIEVGQKIMIGHDEFTVVGLMQGMLEANGDPMLALNLHDLLTIRAWAPSEAVLLRRAEAAASSNGSVSENQDPGAIAAVMLRLEPDADREEIRQTLSGWPDVSIVSRDEQRNLLINGRLERLRKQILLFTSILMVITAVVVTLIIYTMTIEKLHTIAMLKLIGARNAVISRMILQQAILLGVVGAMAAWGLSHLLAPAFPRRLLLLGSDALLLQAIVLVTCVLGSLGGLIKALSVRAELV